MTLPIGSQADKIIAVQTYTGTVPPFCRWQRKCGRRSELSEGGGGLYCRTFTYIDEMLCESERSWQDRAYGQLA